MTTSIPLPITIEQIADVLKKLGQVERYQLQTLVPDLQFTTPIPAENKGNAQFAQLDAEMIHAFGKKPLSEDKTFFGGINIDEYFALPDEERGRLWDEWGGGDAWIDELEAMDETMSAG